MKNDEPRQYLEEEGHHQDQEQDSCSTLQHDHTEDHLCVKNSY